MGQPGRAKSRAPVTQIVICHNESKVGPMNLEDRLDNVKDQESFILFVRDLIADRQDEVKKESENPSNKYGPGANGWENGSIESFLDAGLSWAEDTDFGETQGLGDECVWRKIANFLYCGKIYE